MQKNLTRLLAAALIILILAACDVATPTPEVDTEMTAAIDTMVASVFDTQTALVTPATVTSTPSYTPFPTVTPFYTPISLASPTFVYFTPTLGSLTPGSPTPTGTLATATINPNLLGVGCNNLFFVRDVNIPAGTVLRKNQDFTKTWKVQNTGTCDWLYQYSLVLLSGEAFGDQSTKIQKLVKVNDWTELSVNATAPNKAGTYTSYWRLSNGQGMFGATLVLSFVVADTPTATKVPTLTNTSAPVPTSTFTFTPLPTETPSETPTP